MVQVGPEFQPWRKQQQNVPDLIEVTPQGEIVLNFHEGQLKLWMSNKRFLLALAGTQGGKRLRLDEPIPTPQGFRPLGELRIGDEVFDEQGQVCRITALSPIEWGQVYEIEFDDGVTIQADANHNWYVQSVRQRKNQARRVKNPNPAWACRPQCQPTPDYSVLTTEELRRELYVTVGGKRRANYSIPLTQPVQYPERDLPIPPYTLGAWLGDGNSCGGTITVHDKDREILDNIRAEGVHISIRKRRKGKTPQYGLLGLPFRELGLIDNKHVPDMYLTASIEQRLALLQGLMDTNGYCKPTGRAEFVSKSKRLAEQVAELCRSLGIKARISDGKAKSNGRNYGSKYRVHFSTHLQVFKLSRKRARQKNVQGRNDLYNRYIVDIRPVESAPMRCISVDSPKHLYLAGRDYVVTHNTSFGPPWLHREMQLMGPGDYMVVAPTFKLLDKKALPEFRRYFETILGLGYYVGAPHQEFRVTEEGSYKLFGTYDPLQPTRVFFGHAQDPESLESATAKAAWLDEAGQDRFKLGSWEAILRRLSLHMGRVLLTTTPYNFGWLKRKLYDPWKRANGKHELIEVSRFESRMNPRFPLQEWYRAQRDLPPWKFDMMYRAIFTRPAGMIYDVFNEELHVVEPFEISPKWRRYIGLDFGGVNTAAVFLAENPSLPGHYYIYNSYHAGGRTAEEHAKAIVARAGGTITGCYGGAKSEGQWRREFAAGGLVVLEPLESSVEVGIDRVYGALKEERLYVFEDQEELINEIMSYSREIDDNGEPTEKIADKSQFHLLDALRYIVGGKLEQKFQDIDVPGYRLPFGNLQKPEEVDLPPMFRD